MFKEESMRILVRAALVMGLAVVACSAQAADKDQAARLKALRAAAKAGDAKAEYDLAYLYLRGAGVSRNEKTAVGWYLKSAEQGYAPAQSALGTLYMRGTGVPKDEAQALVWVRKAADQGEALAQSDLGMMYLQGKAVPQDDTQAVIWLRMGAEQGAPAPQHNLASLYERGGAGLDKDDAEAIRWYTKAAVQPSWELGVMQSRQKLCEFGGEQQVWCAEVRTPGAFGPLDKLTAAAERGDTQALTNLGDVHRAGIGVPKDEAQAADWYRKAAELGDARAQSQLGYMYDTGAGVPKDEDSAVAWYCKAAAQGHSRALANLGIMRALGQMSVKDCSER